MQLGGVGNRCHFGTVRTILTVPIDTTSQGHHNQLATPLVWVEMTGGLRGGFIFRRVELIRLAEPHQTAQRSTTPRPTVPDTMPSHATPSRVERVALRLSDQDAHVQPAR